MQTTALLLSVIFSSVGLGYFIYGKKQQQSVPLICGLALMIYPYFIDSAALMSAIGILLIAVPRFIRL
ncbi:amino acid transport protein [Acinetobacter pragensis]|uniref:Amino acid transport protein n=1 Tax=Acinetobacter pragensis TaxID=1806892 RepID=A0A151Y6U9_9GAMM|nr:amino acid transport protein [Acinetobacter pragensis]KYQ73719.1 amino acid transport protein [Acinetobacter pragensis]